MKKRIGVLLSGRGSNFQALADSVASSRIPNAEIAMVISNREGAPGIDRAKTRGIATRVIPSKGLERETYDRQVVAALNDHKVDLVCLAGYASLVAVLCGFFPKPHTEHSPVAASFLSGPRIPAAGS